VLGKFPELHARRLDWENSQSSFRVLGKFPADHFHLLLAGKFQTRQLADLADYPAACVIKQKIAAKNYGTASL
jgi:hypothetical protein